MVFGTAKVGVIFGDVRKNHQLYSWHHRTEAACFGKVSVNSFLSGDILWSLDLYHPSKDGVSLHFSFLWEIVVKNPAFESTWLIELGDILLMYKSIPTIYS